MKPNGDLTGHRKMRFTKLVTKACLEQATRAEISQLEGFQKLRRREWNKTHWGRMERYNHRERIREFGDLMRKMAAMGYPEFLTLIH